MHQFILHCFNKSDISLHNIAIELKFTLIMVLLTNSIDKTAFLSIYSKSGRPIILLHEIIYTDDICWRHLYAHSAKRINSEREDFCIQILRFTV